MDKKIILVVLVALALASVQAGGILSFDLQSASCDSKAIDYWTFTVPCAGGSGNYGYTCDLPQGWLLQNNKFKIPSSHSQNYNQEYVTRCKVKDNVSNNVLERALSFKCTQAGFVINDYDYYYGQTSFSTGNLGSIGGLDILNRLNTLTGPALAGPAISGFTTLQNLGSLGSFGGYNLGGASSYYSGFASWTDCDVMIKNGNSVEILQLIQKVVSSSIKCEAKVAYLTDLLGRICAGIEIKKENINSLTVLIQNITEAIRKLLDELSVIKGQQSQLNCDRLKDNLAILTAKLKKAYSDYNTCIDCTKNDRYELEQKQKELQEIIACLKQIQIDIDNWNATIVDIDAQIRDLQNKIDQLNKKKCNAQDQIAILIKTQKQKFAIKCSLEDRIKWLIANIAAKQAECKRFKEIAVQIQYDIKCLQEEIAKCEQQCHTFDDQITAKQCEIDRLRAQLEEYNRTLRAIRCALENLQSALCDIKQQITYVNYNCHDCKNAVADNTKPEPYFKFQKNDWFQYLNSCYSIQPAQIQISFPSVTVEIKTINIFAPVFTQNYGSCFGDQIKTRGGKWDSDTSFGFEGDFSCSANVDNVAVKKGKIRAINNKYVDVDCDDGSQARLKLGSCSKFEGQGQDFVPKVGHNINFQGSKNNDSTFNLHSCTCY